MLLLLGNKIHFLKYKNDQWKSEVSKMISKAGYFYHYVI